jgi:predicted DNA-binding protein
MKSIRISPSLEERLGIVSRRNKMTESAYLSGALCRQIMVEAITPALDGT